MKLLFSFLLLSSLGTYTLNAQTPWFEWANRTGGSSNETSNDITTDATGNIITIGTFSNTIDFDPGPNTLNTTALGGTDTYLQKFDTDGHLIWAKHMGGAETMIPKSIVTDDDNSVYITGYFSGTIDVDPGPNAYSLYSSAWVNNGFIVKLDSNGLLQWGHQIPSLSDNKALDIAIDHSGNVITTGLFNGVVDFDPGAGVSNLNGTQSQNCFIYKLNTNGEYIWAKAFSGGTNHTGYVVDVDAYGNVYTSGVFNGNTDFDPGTDSTILQTPHDALFINKLDSNGQFVWVKEFGSNSTLNPYASIKSLQVSPEGMVYLTGDFLNTADFNPGTASHNLTSNGLYDAYILKLNSLGNFVWVKQFSGLQGETCLALTLDDNQNIYSTGYFIGTTDFNPNAGVYNLTSNGATDIYINKLDSNGNFIWARQMGGIADDQGYSIALNVSGDLFTVGHFTSTVDFDPNTGSYPLTAMGLGDAFIQKLSSCISTTITPNVLNLPPLSAICKDLVVDSPISTGNCGNTIIGTANTSFPITDTTISEIIWTFDDGNGNSITQNQTIDWLTIDTSLSINSGSIMANNANATYQWFQCYEGLSVIPGAINQSYEPINPGYYAVEITQNGCVDTSACVLINNIGIEETNMEAFFKVYPNPTHGEFVLRFDNTEAIVELIITNVYGQIIAQERLNSIASKTFHLNQPSGIYFLTVLTKSDRKTIELVIE